jgi:predicted AAA+ superfamily ATPase
MEYSEDMIFTYLLGVYNTILIKDIIANHAIKNIDFFKDLYKYTLSNI